MKNVWIRWLALAVVWSSAVACQCNPQQPLPDGGSASLAWPTGAQLRVTATTATGASLAWPTALGPVTGYRLTAPGAPATTTATTADVSGLTAGTHARATVVAFAADGAESVPLAAEVAPAVPLQPGAGDISTDFCGANAFLVRGRPIPCGVFSVLIGHVRTRDGVGVPGVAVSVLGHPEWGNATSQADGLYALAVEAGARTLDLRASAFLPVQRFVTAPPRDFAYVPDVVVLRRDEKSTAVSMSAGGFHKATTQTDRDGPRTTSVFVPAGTSAFLRFADGGTQPAPTLTLRATEATVGPSGPEAMPASLPAATAYTFAADVSADEALAAGAVGVGFGAPVAMYADNFLKFPVGAAIPLGLYDEAEGRWESAPNAVVIQVGQPTGVALLPGELAALTANFAAGTELVRSTTTHFSTFDTNPCSRCVGSCEPNGTAAAANRVACPTCVGGSVIRVENRTLSEVVPVKGTPYALTWHSHRGNVRKAQVDLKLGNLDDGGTPEKVQGTYFRVEVAGRTLVDERLDGGVGDSVQLTWDGKDAFGRAVRGPVAATGSTGYGFGATSVESSSGPGGIVELEPSTFGVWPPPGARAFSSTREALYYLQHTSLTLGDWVGRENLGNFNLDVVHGYSEDGTLHLGTGGEVSVKEGGPLLTFVAGGGSNFGEDAGARDLDVGPSPPMAAGPQGIFYVEKGARIRLLRPDAGVVTVAGDVNTGFVDDVPGAQARFAYPNSIRADAAGNLFVADVENHRIRRLDAQTGRVTTVVGNGQQGFSPDGTPALSAKLDGVSAVLVSRENVLYFMSSDAASGSLLRRLDADGTIFTVAGGSTAASPPWEAASPRAIVFRGGQHWIDEDAEGRIFVAGYDSGLGASTSVVRRIDPDGRVHLLTGLGASTDPEERVAAKTCIAGITGLAVAGDGTVYVGEDGRTGCGVRGGGIRSISADGAFSLFFGGARSAVSPLLPPDGIATATLVNVVGEVIRQRDGSLAVVHRGQSTTVHRIAFPQSWASRAIPSRDGEEVYVFDGQGRHLRTVSARSGLLLHQLGWTDQGLASITDADGDVTQIERAADGAAKALIGPDGQRTELTISNGRITRVTDAAGRFVEAAYTAEGLVSEWKDENGRAAQMTWDAAGNLLTHTDARGAKRLLEAQPAGVKMTSAQGRTLELGIGRVGAETIVQTRDWDDTVMSLAIGGGARTVQRADGAVVDTVMQPGPSARFGRAVDVPGRTSVKMPSGLEAVLTETRTAVSGPTPLDVAGEVDEVRVNGRPWKFSWDASAKTHVVLTPEGRTTTVTVDAKQRPVTFALPGLLPVTVTWDARGRLASMAQGARSHALTWGANGFVATEQNALNEVGTLTTDATGRLGRLTRPDTKDVAFTHDPVGNLTSVTPAGRSAHAFSYSATREPTAYTPPALGGVSPETSTFDLDGLLTAMGHADATSTTVMRAASGRVTQVTTPWWSTAVTYTATTGQIASLTRGAQRLDFVHDGFLLRKETATGVAPAVTEWAWDSSFRVSAHAIGGASVAYGYDQDSLLTQAGAATLARVPATGQLASVAVGTVTTAFTWNGYGEPMMRATTAGATALYSEGMQFDAAGRVTVIEEIAEGVPTQWTYGHDVLGRLTSASKNGVPAGTWAYDGNGNRISEGGTAATFDAQDRLLSRGATTYTWSPLGTRLTKTDAGGTTQYTHDGLGALLSVTRAGVAIAYDHDAQQRRVAKRRNGVVEQRWVYDGPTRIAAELDASGAVTSRFVYGSQPHSPDYVVKGGVTYVLVKNHLGSVRQVVDAATGAVAQRLDYDPWGNVVADSAPGFQPFGFAGGLHDADTGLVHFGRRDYDPQAGVWTAKDPIRLRGGLNVYAYGGSSPVMAVDPTGTFIRFRGMTDAQIAESWMLIYEIAYRKKNSAIGRKLRRLINDPTKGVVITQKDDEWTTGAGGLTGSPIGPADGRFCELAYSFPGHLLWQKKKGVDAKDGHTPLSLLAHELGHAWWKLYVGTDDWAGEQEAIDWENEVLPADHFKRVDHAAFYPGQIRD